MIKNVSPKKKISKKSRYHSMKALEIIRKIEEKYSSMSNISVLSEEQLAWLKQSVIEFNQHIDETHFSGFSFKKEIASIRNSFAHPKEDETNKTQNHINQFFSLLPQVTSELEKNIKKDYSENKKFVVLKNLAMRKNLVMN